MARCVPVSVLVQTTNKLIETDRGSRSTSAIFQKEGKLSWLVLFELSISFQLATWKESMYAEKKQTAKLMG